MVQFFPYSIPVLTFHDISNCGTRVSVTPSFFDRILAYFNRRNYEAITISTLLNHLETGNHADLRQTVLFTFDDVCLSVYDRALPRLNDRGFVGNAFVATKYIGQTNQPFSPQMKTLNLLGEEELTTLADNGWEIHSHTHGHHNLTNVSEPTLRKDLNKSRNIILNSFPTYDQRYLSMSYPYNDSTAQSRALCSEYVATAFNGGGVSYRPYQSRMNVPRIEPEQNQYLKFILKLYRVRWYDLFKKWIGMTQ